MSSERDLKPCPLSIDTEHKVYIVHFEPIGDLNSNTHYVQCDCGCRGPERYGDSAREEAIRAWNTRTVEANTEVVSTDDVDAKRGTLPNG